MMLPAVWLAKHDAEVTTTAQGHQLQLQLLHVFMRGSSTTAKAPQHSDTCGIMAERIHVTKRRYRFANRGTRQTAVM